MDAKRPVFHLENVVATISQGGGRDEPTTCPCGGRSRQVYNHHPYPHTRTRVLANKCSIFCPHTEHMFDTVKPENPCYFFAHPYRRFFRNTGPIGSPPREIPKPSRIKNSILFFIFINFFLLFPAIIGDFAARFQIFLHKRRKNSQIVQFFIWYLTKKCPIGEKNPASGAKRERKLVSL